MSLENDVLRFDKAVFERAHVRMKTAPLELTEADFDQLGIVSPGLQTEAYEARRLAQLALVPPVPDPPLVTKAADLGPAPDDVAEFLKTHGSEAVTWTGLDEVVNILIEMSKGLKGRIDTLEQTNTALQSRVLELEAQAAARSAVEA
jgi:hypothetical protein